jgi:hypothetical protein
MRDDAHLPMRRSTRPTAAMADAAATASQSGPRHRTGFKEGRAK